MSKRSTRLIWACARRWLGVNPALCKILGYVEAELLERDVLSITHPEDRFPGGPQILLREWKRIAPIKRLVRKDGRIHLGAPPIMSLSAPD